MGSKVYDGVRFSAYPLEHPPPHVHGSSSEVVVIVDLLPGGKVALSDREDAVDPKNAKRNVVSKVLRVAGKHAGELNTLWEKAHGKL